MSAHKFKVGQKVRIKAQYRLHTDIICTITRQGNRYDSDGYEITSPNKGSTSTTYAIQSYKLEAVNKIYLGGE